MRTLKVHGQTLQQLTKLSITEVHKLCHETSKTLDPDLLIAKMVHIYIPIKIKSDIYEYIEENLLHENSTFSR